METALVKNKTLAAVKSYAIITLGIVLYAIAWTIFILPNGMVTGGVTGLSAIIQYASGGLINMGYSYFVLNAILLVVAMKMLGQGFGFKTIYAIVLMTLSLKLLPPFIPEQIIQDIAVDNGKLLCAIIGGGLSGVGIAMTISQGGSSGGTDIVALIINKYKPISIGRGIVIADCFIILSSLLVPSDSFVSRLSTVFYGFVIMGVFSYALDLFLSGNKQAVQILVFSKKYEEIADFVSSNIGRGVSVIDSKGWYTKQEGHLLLIVSRKTEMNAILASIKRIDPQAFTTVSNAIGVFGVGFEHFKK